MSKLYEHAYFINRFKFICYEQKLQDSNDSGFPASLG